MGTTQSAARGRMTPLVALALLAASLFVSSPPAGAQETITVTGELEYESPPPSQIVESIAANTVILEFPPDGGPFTGTAALDLTHNVPDRGCVFQSTHAWDFFGEYSSETGQFSGEYIEVDETTTGACESFTFTRTFDPDESGFNAVLIKQLGEIRSQIPPLEFTLMVDPELLGDATAEPAPPQTTQSTNPGATTQTSPPTSEGTTPASTTGTTTTDTGSGGFPWPIIVIPLLLAAALATWLRMRTPKAIEEKEDSGDCSDEERRWREAQDACDEARARSKQLSSRFDELVKRMKDLGTELDGLPSEETRVELPDGRSLSQLDLELRRQAAGAAWDEYMANPTPESAAAAEQAWERQATPEWLEEQRRTHGEMRARLQKELDDARSAKDEVGKDLAEARTAEQDACRRAAEARRELDRCLQAAVDAAAAQPTPAPQPPVPTPEPPATEPEGEPVPAVVPPSAGNNGDGDKRCREGAERWLEFDGPHPFTVPSEDEYVTIRMALKAGTRTYTSLGSLNQAPFVRLDEARQANGIHFSYFASLTESEVRSAFSGENGLARLWETVGSGAVQQLAITLLYRKRPVMATCERKEQCVDGEWQPQRQWRSRSQGEIEQVEHHITIRGNIDAGMGRAEADYLSEIVSFFSRHQAEVRRLLEAKDQLQEYERDCRQGRR